MPTFGEERGGPRQLEVRHTDDAAALGFEVHRREQAR